MMATPPTPWLHSCATTHCRIYPAAWSRCWNSSSPTSAQGPKAVCIHITKHLLPAHEELSYTQWQQPTIQTIIETSKTLCTLLCNSKFESSGLWYDLLLFCFFSFVCSWTMTCSNCLHAMWIGLGGGGALMKSVLRLCTDKHSSLWVVLYHSLSKLQLSILRPVEDVSSDNLSNWWHTLFAVIESFPGLVHTFNC